jgi:hypothetical protein
LKSQSFECRPLHGSLPLVLLRPASCMLGLFLCTGTAAGLVGLTGLATEVYCDCAATGGMAIGDLERLRDVAPRERLRERPRIRAEMAPKNDSSVGEAVIRDVGDAGEYSGEV